jgi:hypothetical protein
MSSEVNERVSFRFGPETEVRYLTRVPEVGDHVTRGSEIWVVSAVTTDEVGALVTCELSLSASGA